MSLVDFKLSKVIDSTSNVAEAVSRGAVRMLRKASFFVFKTARDSIEISPDASPAGTPPHSRSGQLQRALAYDVDPKTETAVIGPRFSFVGVSAVPEEFGGEYKGAMYPERSFMGPALQGNINLLAEGFTGEVHS